MTTTPRTGSTPHTQQAARRTTPTTPARETGLIWLDVGGQLYRCRFWTPEAWAMLPTEARPASAIIGEDGGYWAFEPHGPANPGADRLSREESDAATEAMIAAMKAQDDPGFKAWSDALGAALGPNWPAEVRARGVARVRELLRDVQSIGSTPSSN
jgi:hypothetical protein